MSTLTSHSATIRLSLLSSPIGRRQRRKPPAETMKTSKQMRWLQLRVATACCLATLAALLQPAQADDKIKELIKANGFIEIKLIEAKVPDMDPLPMQGDSDVFARVYLNHTKEMVCETQPVQDDNSPKFDKECKTNRAVPSETILRIELFDSDKPAPEPDWIGMTKVKVSDLILNRRLDSKEMFPIEGRNFPKYYIKAKIDFKPQK